MKKTTINLVPASQNTSPDYYCTWQTQLYATSDGKPAGQRAIIGEKGLFSEEKPYGWAYFYPAARGDLFLVMDDSWDVPLSGDSSYYGSLQLSPEKFPEAYKGSRDATEALGRLVSRIESLGWRGLGGWVCAQPSPHLQKEGESSEEYWTARMKEADASGFSYWKVDWGDLGLDLGFRSMLTERAKEHAPRLTVENACIPSAIPYSDVFRTYDVPAVLSIPMTVNKLKDCLASPAPQEGCAGLINCEDEVYTAAAGGFVMGIMRHPYVGSFVNGKADMSFPDTHRRLKTKMAEVTRAVRFHRIAPAFGVGGEVAVSEEELYDRWDFAGNCADELEAWWLGNTSLFAHIGEDYIAVSAPAAIARNLPLPTVTAKDGEIPYTVCARHPNGTVSVATLGRTRGRSYEIPPADVAVQTENATLFGIFGEYAALSLVTSFEEKPTRILAQDLAAETAYDVTEEVTWQNGTLTLPGALIHTVGTEKNSEGDTSEPGVILHLIF